MNISKFNTLLTMEYLTNNVENLYFERKSARISNNDLANEIAAMANANGGTIVVGITDDGNLEGFNEVGNTTLNNIQKVVNNFLKPSPVYKIEIINIKNTKGEEDHLILFHVSAANDFVVHNNKDEVYLRQGDSTIKLTHDQIRSLEYERHERNFETIVLPSTSIDDVDLEVMEIYKEKIHATNLSNEQVLKARGFLVNYNGKYSLTNAGMLLFGKKPTIYFPQARVRVLKFEGTEFQVGTDMNIVKDKTFDRCLYRIINEASDFIKSQLREFTYLHPDGFFKTIPEYPEFAWYEGMVNAIIHRDYSNYGDHITIKLYDDRMEIKSPGRLGGVVTLDNMKYERYSRNPQISRVLAELGIVRELNEGIKRMCREMKEFFLKEPIYSTPNNSSVLLVLDNNIEARSKRKRETLEKKEKINTVWNDLSYQEKKVLQNIYENGSITSMEVAKMIERSKPTAVKVLNKLMEKDLIVWTGTDKRDTYGNYIMK